MVYMEQFIALINDGNVNFVCLMHFQVKRQYSSSKSVNTTNTDTYRIQKFNDSMIPRHNLSCNSAKHSLKLPLFSEHKLR